MQLFPSVNVLQKYSLYKEYLTKAIDRRKEWEFGISNINFVPQTAKERFNLAILAVGNNNNFSAIQFVSSPHFYKDQDKDHDEQQVILPSMPADSQESISTETNDNCISSQTDANLPDAELSVDQIIKLHQQLKSPKILSTSLEQAILTSGSAIINT